MLKALSVDLIQLLFIYEITFTYLNVHMGDCGHLFCSVRILNFLQVNPPYFNKQHNLKLKKNFFIIV